MIAVDTNLLVYAVREDSPWHKDSYLLIRRLAESGQPWAVPWHCIHEFIGVVTHPRIYKPPTQLADAITQVTYWLESPYVRFIGEAAGYWGYLQDLLVAARASGGIVHDARIVAVCLSNGVRELWSADRNFSRFPSMRVRNPLIEKPTL